MSEPDRPDEQRPATVAQVKGLRRWLIVAGVWAVAATALAVFALIQANRADDEGREQAVGEVGRVQRQLNERIDDLEQRVDGLPTSADLSDLENRLGQVEDDASQATQDVERLSNRVDDLEGRVDQLEQEGQADQGEGDTETAP
jgi:septal ring factor EnvC (AmiA/AmiB activator)